METTADSTVNKGANFKSQNAVIILNSISVLGCDQPKQYSAHVQLRVDNRNSLVEHQNRFAPMRRKLSRYIRLKILIITLGI